MALTSLPFHELHRVQAHARFCADRKVRCASDSRCGPLDAECTNHARRGGSIHSNCGLVLRRGGAGISGASPPDVTPGAGFGHDHKVFELQEVFELNSFFGTQSIGFGQFDQVRNACQRFFRGTERVYLLGVTYRRR